MDTLLVRFDASGSTSGIDGNTTLTYRWTIYRGTAAISTAPTSASAQKFKFPFDSSGIYRVVLAIKNSSGRTDSISINLGIDNQYPGLSLYFNKGRLVWQKSIYSASMCNYTEVKQCSLATKEVSTLRTFTSVTGSVVLLCDGDNMVWGEPDASGSERLLLYLKKGSSTQQLIASGVNGTFTIKGDLVAFQKLDTVAVYKISTGTTAVVASGLRPLTSNRMIDIGEDCAAFSTQRVSQSALLNEVLLYNGAIGKTQLLKSNCGVISMIYMSGKNVAWLEGYTAPAASKIFFTAIQ